MTAAACSGCDGLVLDLTALALDLRVLSEAPFPEARSGVYLQRVCDDKPRPEIFAACHIFRVAPVPPVSMPQRMHAID